MPLQEKQMQKSSCGGYKFSKSMCGKASEKGFREEYAGTDEGITVQITDLGVAEKVLHPTSREKVLFFLMDRFRLASRK